jgi:hypothetical protein
MLGSAFGVPVGVAESYERSVRKFLHKQNWSPLQTTVLIPESGVFGRDV